MALWAKVQQLGEAGIHQVRSQYGEHFPIEVRSTLADWIEEKILCTAANVNPENSAHHQFIRCIVLELIDKLEAQAQAMVNIDPFLIRIPLMNAARNFRHRFPNNSVELFTNLRNCLAIETYLVKQQQIGSQEQSLAGSNSLPDDGEEINEKIKQLQQQTTTMENILSQLGQGKEKYVATGISIQEMEESIKSLKENSQPITPQAQETIQLYTSRRDACKSWQTQIMPILSRLVKDLQTTIGETITELSFIQAKVLEEELVRWKNEQKLSNNKVALSNNLQKLQTWCEGLAELIWKTRNHLKEVERLQITEPFSSLPHFRTSKGSVNRFSFFLEKATSLLISLVTNTFIIVRQPKQVVRKKKGFESTVRLLVGGPLNLYLNPPQVKVAIISEAQTKNLHKKGFCDTADGTKAKIVNNIGTMKYNEKHQLTAHFGNMMLESIQRTEKAKDDSVMDEKMCLYFQCQFSLGEKQLEFNIWAYSLPIVVVVHTNQEPKAWATVTWDNAFGEQGRMPFEVPQQAPWTLVAQALSSKFESMNGRDLTEQNLQFLGEKAYSNRNFQMHDFFTWSQFCKETLTPRNFTFWEWFYACLKLTNEYFEGPWKDGWIHGFLSRQHAEVMLSVCPAGTFLLRFSDSVLGGIVISWIHTDRKVYSLTPYTNKDLATLSLAKQILNLPQLSHLYPQIKKAVAFKQYDSNSKTDNPFASSYVYRSVIPFIPGMCLNSGNSVVDSDELSQPSSPMLSHLEQSPVISSQMEAYDNCYLTESVVPIKYHLETNFEQFFDPAFNEILNGMTMMDSDEYEDDIITFG